MFRRLNSLLMYKACKEWLLITESDLWPQLWISAVKILNLLLSNEQMDPTASCEAGIVTEDIVTSRALLSTVHSVHGQSLFSISLSSASRPIPADAHSGIWFERDNTMEALFNAVGGLQSPGSSVTLEAVDEDLKLAMILQQQEQAYAQLSGPETG